MKAGDTCTPLGNVTRRWALNTTTSENTMRASAGGRPSCIARPMIEPTAATKSTPVYQASCFGKGSGLLLIGRCLSSAENDAYERGGKAAGQSGYRSVPIG